MASPFCVPVKPDWEALVRCIRRQGTPRRVHHMELYLDREMQDALCARYNLLDGVERVDPYFEWRKQIILQRFLGYDTVRCTLDDLEFPLNRTSIGDTAALGREGGRAFMDEHRGPITTWAEFEAYPWPVIADASTRSLEWLEANLPDDMCVVANGGFAHFCEYLSWLPGYETLCFMLHDQRDLVRAISDRLVELSRQCLERILQFSRVQIIWGSDDMGFRSGTLIRPADLRAFVLPGHKLMAEMSHAAGRPYLLHSCGNLASIMEDLIEDVRIDAKHSFEDTIEDVNETKDRYGARLALIGGIDVDFLCRADERAIRLRVRRTLSHCMTGGGYVLGTGNSVANYIPVDSYLAMVDEGRRFLA